MLVQEMGTVCYRSTSHGWLPDVRRGCRYEDATSTDFQDGVLCAKEEALGVLLSQLVHLIQGSVASQLGSTARQMHPILPDLPRRAHQDHSDQQERHDVARVAASGIVSEAQPVERQRDGEQHVCDRTCAHDGEAEQETAYEPFDEPRGLPGRADVQGPRFAPGAVEDCLVEQAVINEETDGRPDEVLDDLEGIVKAVDVYHRVCVVGQERRGDEGAAEDENGEENRGHCGYDD